MKLLVFAFLLIYSGIYSQGKHVLDTIYHPFYNGQQVIEIKEKEAYSLEKGFIECSVSKDNPSSLPIYIIRNKKGKILSIHNSFEGDFSESSLISPEESLLKSRIHKKRTKNTSSYIGNDNSGFNILYPVYKLVSSTAGKKQILKVGLMDSMGILRFPVEFEEIQWIDSVFIAKKASKYFLYDTAFNPVLDEAYEEMSYINTISNQLIVKQSGKFGLIRRDGKVLLPIKYNSLRQSRFMNGYYEFKEGDKWGFVSYDFKRFLKPFSPSSDLYSRDGYFVYGDEVSLWNVIDSAGRRIFQSPSQIFNILSEKRFIIGKYDARSLCDEQGKILTKIPYHVLWKINGNTFIGGFDAAKQEYSGLMQSTKWHLLDADGKLKTDKVYESLIYMDSNWLKVYENKQLFVIDDSGNTILGNEGILDVYKYTDHVYAVRKEKTWSYIDLYQTQIRTEEFDSHLGYRNGMLIVEKDKKWGIIDSTLRQVTPLVFDKVESYIDGITTALVKENEWIILDKQGKLVINAHYDKTLLLGNGYCQVEYGGKSGIVDRSGNYVVPMEYDAIRSVIQHKNEYYIAVKKNDKFGIINMKNEIIYPIEFQTYAEISVHVSIEQKRQDGFYAFFTIDRRSTSERYYMNFDPAKNQIIIAENPSLGFKKVSAKTKKSDAGLSYGVADWTGKIVIPCIYMNIGDFKNYTFRVYTEKGGGLVDTTGKVLIPAVYKYLYDLGSDCPYIQTGRHYGPWGLYTYSGRKIADTIYGGFEKPVFGLIPFYANFNHRYDKTQKEWIHDEKRMGFMNSDGKIVIDALYERYTVPDATKEEILLVKDQKIVKINARREVLEGEILKPDSVMKNFSKKELRKLKRAEKRKNKAKKARWM